MSQVRFACPRNGEPGYCEVCKKPAPHRYEVLVPSDRKPVCPWCKVPLVKEP